MVAPATPVNVEPELDKIVSNEYGDVKFAGQTWPWDDGPADTFIQTINNWNHQGQIIRTYISKVPQIKKFPTKQKIMYTLGDDYQGPQYIDPSHLIKGLNEANRNLFEKFKNALKQHRAAAKKYHKKCEPFYSIGQFKCASQYVKDGQDVDIPTFSVRWEYGDEELTQTNEVCQIYSNKQSWISHMDTLFAGLENLWTKYAEERYNDRVEEDAEENGDVVDEFIIITDLDAVINKGIFNRFRNGVFMRPEASDIPNLTGRYNPPAHLATRSFALSAFNFEGEELILNDEQLDSAVNRSGFDGSFGLENPATKEGLNNQLGFFYQDVINTNKVKNKRGKEVHRGFSKRISELWGFQFIYNPSTISYTTSSSPDIDWAAQGSGEGMDPSNILFGQSTVQFSLMLNRIVDMSALRSAVYASQISGTNFQPRDVKQLLPEVWSKGYPRPITKEDVFGILSRGTEYDLEFLYRVINGNPEPTPTMKTGAKTADFGILYGLPVWVRFHDNLRYKGVITSLSVNHMIFTHNMIPILSEVTIGFARIPVIAWDADLNKEIYKDIKNGTGGSGDEEEE